MAFVNYATHTTYNVVAFASTTDTLAVDRVAGAGLVVLGNRAYQAGCSTTTARHINTWDISDPTNPIDMGYSTDSGNLMGYGAHAYDGERFATGAFGPDGGFYWWDINNDIDDPENVGFYQPSPAYGATATEDPAPVFNSLLAVRMESSGPKYALAFWVVLGGGNPVYTSMITSDDDSRLTRIDGRAFGHPDHNRVFISNFDGIVVLNLAIPTVPVVLDEWLPAGWSRVNELHYAGPDHLCATGSGADGLVFGVFDISSGSPVLTGETTVGSGRITAVGTTDVLFGQGAPDHTEFLGGGLWPMNPRFGGMNIVTKSTPLGTRSGWDDLGYRDDSIIRGWDIFDQYWPSVDGYHLIPYYPDEIDFGPPEYPSGSTPNGAWGFSVMEATTFLQPPSTPVDEDPYQYQWANNTYSQMTTLRRIGGTEFVFGDALAIATASIDGPTTVTEIDEFVLHSGGGDIIIARSYSEVDTSDGRIMLGSNGGFDDKIASFQVDPATNISHDDSFEWSGEFSEMPFQTALDTVADVLYVPRSGGGSGEPILKSLDVSNRSALGPELDEILSDDEPDLVNLGSYCCLSADRNTLYMTGGLRRLARVDVSNPSALSYIDRSVAYNDFNNQSHHLTLFNGFVFTLMNNLTEGEPQIVKWDVSGTPFQAEALSLGTTFSAGYYLHPPSGLMYVGFQDNVVPSASRTSTIQTWDVTGTTPVMISSISGLGWGGTSTLLVVGDNDEYLITAARDGLSNSNDPDLNVWSLEVL